MNNIDILIAQYCPDGVAWKIMGEIAKISNGRDHKLLSEGKIPVYGSGGIMRYANKYIYDQQSVLIPRKGSIGNIFYIDIPFWTVDTIFYTKINCDLVSPKYLYYYLKTQHLEDLNTAGGVPSLTKSVLDKVPIPIPPLPVQQEIVNILDNFTQLQAELEAELQARRAQYEYYRNELLDFEGKEVEWSTLGKIGKVCMCKRVMKHETKTVGDIPFYKIGTFGKKADAYISKELYEDYRKRFSFPKVSDILISASGTIGRTVVYDGKLAYFQDSNIVWIDNDESKVTNKFLFYFYKIVEWKTDGGTISRLYNDNLAKTKIPIPPLAEQDRIVAILDKFDKLINGDSGSEAGMTGSLPAEIRARRKQYEYYRGKLLDFKPLAQ